MTTIPNPDKWVSRMAKTLDAVGARKRVLMRDVQTPDGPATLLRLEGICGGQWTQAWVRFPDGVERWYSPHNLRPDPTA